MLRSTTLSASLVLIFSCSCHAPQPEIFGKWYFDRFGGPHGEISTDPGIVNANKHNEGLTMTFTPYNKMIGTQKNGSNVDTFTTHYRIISPGRLFVMEGQSDTMRIMLLTSDILELYPTSETKPAMFLKRNKDKMTAMSAPN
jgi:hypothetical protein